MNRIASLLAVSLLLAWVAVAHAQLPITGTIDQGVPSSSQTAWPMVPAQAVETMSRTQTSGSNAAQTLTLPGSPGRRVAIRGIVCYLSAAGTSTITISQAGTVMLDLGTFVDLAAAAWSFGLATGVWGAPGSPMTINVGAGGNGVTSTCSVIADRS